MTLLVYSSLLLAVIVLGSPYWVARMLRSGRYRAGLAGRLGRVPAELRSACIGKDVVWLHAVSVGEVLAATRLVTELRLALPGCVVAVSTTTETGQALAQARFAGSPVFYLPLDFGFLMRRYLRVLMPRLVVLMESELWPNMIHECAKAGVPLAGVNARVSDRSFPRYMKLKRVWRPLLREVSLFLAQSEETAQRLRAMGVAEEQVKVAGNLKYDVRAPKESRIAELIREAAAGRPIVVAGSTVDGKPVPEEQVFLQGAMGPVWQRFPNVLLVLAPRHPERFTEVFSLCSELGPALRATDLLRQDGKTVSDAQIIVLDTIGDLAAVCGVADIAFVGGSLVRRGGHSPLEPAQFGVPVVMGPSYENFRDVVESMRAADGIRIVPDKDSLPAALTELLAHPEQAKAMGERGAADVQGTARSNGAGRGGVGGAAAVRRPLLLPLVPLYAAGLWVKRRWLEGQPRRLVHPVVSVGSLSAGGAGKTPVVAALAELLERHGFAVDVLSRGYGRTSDAVERVDPTGDSARFGDEPLLLARARLRVYVGADRYAAGLLAESETLSQTRDMGHPNFASKRRVHLLDDGFQHRRLARALDVVLLTKEDIADWLLPAGNLREPLGRLRAAGAVVLREDEAAALLPLVRRLAGEVPVWMVRRRLSLSAEMGKVVAFCGVARPKGFFGMLPVAPLGTVAFRDHHVYTERDVERLLHVARETRAEGFVTTEKDAVKLTQAMQERLGKVGVARLRVKFLDEAMVAAKITTSRIDQ